MRLKRAMALVSCFLFIKKIRESVLIRRAHIRVLIRAKTPGAAKPYLQAVVVAACGVSDPGNVKPYMSVVARRPVTIPKFILVP